MEEAGVRSGDGDQPEIQAQRHLSATGCVTVGQSLSFSVGATNSAAVDKDVGSDKLRSTDGHLRVCALLE